MSCDEAWGVQGRTHCQGWPTRRGKTSRPTPAQSPLARGWVLTELEKRKRSKKIQRKFPRFHFLFLATPVMAALAIVSKNRLDRLQLYFLPASIPFRKWFQNLVSNRRGLTWYAFKNTHYFHKHSFIIGTSLLCKNNCTFLLCDVSLKCNK